ncbi:MAG TPA: hypothetical protein VG326_03210 [Tepidisphaeraceae bacterium]|jgi:hypothetical protein|nr:hypothetical protein [Tepidisphaeraceae bacterium]
MSCVRTGFSVAVAGLFFFILTGYSYAGLSIVSQNVSIDRPDHDVLFTLNFNQAPDFKTTDLFGRPADSFQYEIVPDTTHSIGYFSVEDIRAVIRGDEIGAGALLPIRDGFEHGSDPSPFSGGWGQTLGTVPFSVQGSRLTFQAPFNLLGITNHSGAFAYRVFTTNFGSTVSEIQSVSISLPPALPAGIIIFSIFAGVCFFRRRASAIR